jgi:hypothetical protein
MLLTFRRAPNDDGVQRFVTEKVVDDVSIELKFLLIKRLLIDMGAHKSVSAKVCTTAQ